MSKKLVISSLLAAAVASPVWAGAKIKIDEVRSLTVGMGLRTEVKYNEVEYRDGPEVDSTDFALSSLRFYLNGKVHEMVDIELNTECETGSDGSCDGIRVLDGVVKVKFSDMFQVWAGRFLPPSDRANLSGPYYANTWTFPIAQAYPAIFAGRDDGLAVWGESGMFKYQLGVFDGVENADNSKLLAARLVLNLLDPETGYYNSSTYYGDKQVLAFGLSHQQQSNVVDNRGDFSGSSIDVLYEQPMSGGTALSLEAAYYNYDYDEVIPDADGGYVLAAFLLAKDGIGGRLQPHLRWQQLSDDSDEEITSKELGINYILDKHNLRMSLLYQDGKLENISVLGTADTKTLTLGMQVQL